MPAIQSPAYSQSEHHDFLAQKCNNRPTVITFITTLPVWMRFLTVITFALLLFPTLALAAAGAPVPLLTADHPVDWWFVFKFNAQSFPGCPGQTSRQCIFGGDVQKYPAYSQQFVFASSENHSLQQGDTCAGTTTRDPVGATFSEIYNGSYYYVVWNDKFFDDPAIKGCNKKCQKPWGHLKGILAWNDDGAGVVMQVSTADWPASGSKDRPRQTDGNTLGCIRTDNDVNASEHFFALKLNHDDVVKVLKALGNASAVTDPANGQIVRNGGPADIQALVKNLGVVSDSTHYTKDDLSSGVMLISKASKLHVPPWQMISALLGGVPLRAAT